MLNIFFTTALEKLKAILKKKTYFFHFREKIENIKNVKTKAMPSTLLIKRTWYKTGRSSWSRATS